MRGRVLKAGGKEVKRSVNIPEKYVIIPGGMLYLKRREYVIIPGGTLYIKRREYVSYQEVHCTARDNNVVCIILGVLQEMYCQRSEILASIFFELDESTIIDILSRIRLDGGGGWMN